MDIRKDACTASKDKNGKTHWQKIGVAFIDTEKDTCRILLNALPVGTYDPKYGFTVAINLFDQRKDDDLPL